MIIALTITANVLDLTYVYSNQEYTMECMKNVVHSFPIDLNDDEVKKSPISHAKVDGTDYYIINDADYIKQVLETPSLYPRSDIGMDGIASGYGRTVLTTDGDLWRKKRKMIMQGLTKKHLEAVIPTIHEYCDVLIDELKKLAVTGEAFQVDEIFMDITMKIASRGLFSVNISDADAKILIKANHIIEINLPLLTSIGGQEGATPTRTNEWVEQAHKDINDIMLNLIDQRVRLKTSNDDLLKILIDHAGNSEALPDQQALIYEALIMLIASHETCSRALSWSMLLLSQHDDIFKKAQQQADEVLSDRVPTPDDFAKLTWPMMIFKETLRLFPSVFMLLRTPLEDTSFGNTTIAAGSQLVIFPWLTHRNPAYWTNPYDFDPTRFEHSAMLHQHDYSYFPFAGGLHTCMGQGLALREVPMMIAQIAQHFRLHHVEKKRLEAYGGVTLRPRYGIWLTLEPR